MSDARRFKSPPKASRARRALLFSAAFVLLWPPLAWGAAVWLAAGGRGDASSEKADALAVLAGSSTYVERARRAALLFNEGRAPRVLLTNDNLVGGWSEAEQRNPLFVERAADELKRAGVPGEKIEIIWRPVESTYEEAVRLREHASSRGLRSLLVVTSAYHARRARWTLERVFRDGGVRVEVEAVETGEQTPRPAAWWLSALGWKLVAGEYLKLIYYRLSYG